MLETPHVAVGAAIASKVVHPALSLPLAFASHFLLERVPHWNPHLNREKTAFGKITAKSTKIVILDSSLALLLGSYVAYKSLPNITHAIVVLLACFVSILPDLVEAPYFFLNYNHPLLQRWIKLQKSIQTDTKFLPGIISQILVTLLALYWIFGS